jgi:hypothetical protein
MKIKRSFFILLSFVFLLSVFLSGCGDDTVSLEKHQEIGNAVKPLKFIIEPPTLICLGFE